MTRRFILTLAMLVLTLGLLASAAPVGATDRPPDEGRIMPQIVPTTGPCLLTGQTAIWTSTGTDFTDTMDSLDTTKLRIRGFLFNVVDQNGLGMGIGSALCSETLPIWNASSRDLNASYAFRVTSATFHGGAHLAPGTQMVVSYRFRNEVPFHAYSNYPNGYDGDYDLTIPNTVSPQGDDWSTCGASVAFRPTVPSVLTFTNAWSFSKWDGGKSKLTGDQYGKYWVDYTLEWAKCTQ